MGGSLGLGKAGRREKGRRSADVKGHGVESQGIRLRNGDMLEVADGGWLVTGYLKIICWI